jgi:endonuclease/exonuclease/phosphatase family metal-dependent hydrolase
MSFNIRYANPGDGRNAWPLRRTLVAGSLRLHDIDVAGLQEALRSQIDDLTKQLPQYAWVGVGRDDGKDRGEFTPIFYRRDRFELPESGTYWLSPTPEKIASKGWDAALPRIATWARLKDKQTGKEWYFVNTHFDHMGNEARIHSAELIVSRMAAIASTGVPVVLTGDLNVPEESAAYRTLVGNSKASKGWHLKDACHESETPHFGMTGTFNGFEQSLPTAKMDYILFAGALRVLQHAIPNDMADGRFASDHFAVIAELTLERPANRVPAP